MNETFDDQTMSKAHHALLESGLTEEQATNAVNAMQNAGILFRERAERLAGDMPPVAPSPASDQPTLFPEGVDPVASRKLDEAARKLADLTFTASGQTESDEVFEAHLEGTDCGKRPCSVCAPNEETVDVDPRDVPPGY